MEQKDKQTKINRMIKKIQDFCLMDDIYMNVFFDDQPKLIQTVLRIILNKPDLMVKISSVQKPYKNFKGHSATLDIFAVDSEDRMYDIEIQNDPAEADPKRAAYHCALITKESLKRRNNYSTMPERYVIFILRGDYYGEGLPFYEIQRTITQLDHKPFGDGSHIFYVNGRYNNDDKLGHLIHDLKCKKPDDMYFDDLKERARCLKNTEGGNDTMCKIMQDLIDEEKADWIREGREEGERKGREEGERKGREEGERKGREEGERKSSVNSAINLLKIGKLTIEEIAKSVDLKIEDVQKLADSLKE